MKYLTVPATIDEVRNDLIYRINTLTRLIKNNQCFDQKAATIMRRKALICELRRMQRRLY